MEIKKGERGRGKYCFIACQFCKKRHRKCDGKRPVCSNCSKAGNECIYRTWRFASKNNRKGGEQNKPTTPPTSPLEEITTPDSPSIIRDDPMIDEHPPQRSKSLKKKRKSELVVDENEGENDIRPPRKKKKVGDDVVKSLPPSFSFIPSPLPKQEVNHVLVKPMLVNPQIPSYLVPPPPPLPSYGMIGHGGDRYGRCPEHSFSHFEESGNLYLIDNMCVYGKPAVLQHEHVGSFEYSFDSIPQNKGYVEENSYKKEEIDYPYTNGELYNFYENWKSESIMNDTNSFRT